MTPETGEVRALPLQRELVISQKRGARPHRRPKVQRAERVGVVVALGKKLRVEAAGAPEVRLAQKPGRKSRNGCVDVHVVLVRRWPRKRIWRARGACREHRRSGRRGWWQDDAPR